MWFGYDGETENGFWPCDPDKEVHELRWDRFRRPGDRCPGNWAERLLEVVQFAPGGRQYERRVVRLTLAPRPDHALDQGQHFRLVGRFTEMWPIIIYGSIAPLSSSQPI